MYCDFCSTYEPLVGFEYPCQSFDVVIKQFDNGPAGLHMVESWLACKDCSDAIERNDLTALALRQLEARDDLPEDIDFQADVISLLVQTCMRFQSLRTGPRRELQPA